MNDEELSAVLQDAGLSPYQAEAYVTLLDLGTAAATDVAEASDVPDPRIYDVLRDLEAKGYVETFQQENLTVRAHDPATVIEDLHSRSDRFLDAADAIEDRWQRPAVGEHELTVVKRFDTVFEQARELVTDADVQVTAAVSPEQFRRLEDDLAAAVDRGVLVLLTVWTDDPEAPAPDGSEFAGACSEVRHRPAPAPFVVIADRTKTCFASRSGTTSEYGLLVDDASHAGVFRWFFTYCLWRNSDVLRSARIDHLPRGYVDIRECAESLHPHLAAGERVRVSVTGATTETNESVELTGIVTDITSGPRRIETADRQPTFEDVVPLGIEIESDEGNVYTVGGWGAILEDVEATRITVTDVTAE